MWAEMCVSAEHERSCQQEKIRSLVRFDFVVYVSLLTSLDLASGCCKGMRFLIPTCISGSVTIDFPSTNNTACMGKITVQEGGSSFLL